MMTQSTWNKFRLPGNSWGVMLLIVFALTIGGQCGVAFAKEGKQKAFKSPEEAVQEMVAAIETNDMKKLRSVFGPNVKWLLSSGDEVADKAQRDHFIQLYGEAHKLTGEGGMKTVLVIGKDDWPFPIPIVKRGKGWLFDMRAGKEEILNRRIGRNELSAIQVCLAVGDAEQEYAHRMGDLTGVTEYAQKFLSSEGKKDGLFWEAKEGEEPSPLGSFVGKAVEEGYGRSRSGNKPVPYHGYFYKILKAQGRNAPGGEYDYVVNGKMIGGFAVVARPAKYGNSGIMTFLMNHDGVVYQKDLGRNTAKTVEAMTKFDPDGTWEKVK